jgi:mannan endo-1,4-beta-mannosidase
MLYLLVFGITVSGTFIPTGAVWKPALGSWNKPILTADNTTWEHTAVQEPQVMYQPETKSLRMWYRGAGWGFPTGVGVADSTDGGLTWSKYNGNPVWTDPISECSGQPWVYKEASDKWWLYTTTNQKPPRTCIAESKDGLSWANVSSGTFHHQSHVPLPPNGTMFGNRAVWKESEGVWKMLQECGTTDGVWEIFLYEGTSAIEWKVANGGAPLRQLQRHSRSMYGGPSIASVDGVLAPRNPSDQKYHIWYHAGANGNLPTDIYHASSIDLLNWTVNPTGPVLQHQGTGSFAFDQVADPSPLAVGDKAFMAYDGDNNQRGADVHAAIGLAVGMAVNIGMAVNVSMAVSIPTDEAQKVDKRNHEKHKNGVLAPTQTSWAGISSYYLYSCNATIRTEALNAVRAAGIKVLRVILLSTEGEGAVAACSSTPTPDLEPQQVGVYEDTILMRLDDLLYEASIRGIKLTVALHDRWSLGCWRSDAYQRKYNLTKVDCKHNASGNDPARFYSQGRNDFKQRIAHILSFVSRHTQQPIGQWRDALFSVEAENEAFGHAQMDAGSADWLCDMSASIREAIHHDVLVTTGGGGIGTAVGKAEFTRAHALSQCASVDVVALHSYSSAADIDRLLTGYASAIGTKRLLLQEWGVTGVNSTAQSKAFTAIAAVAAEHGVPQFVWHMQPSHMPLPSTELAVSAPAPAPSPGRQRVRGADGEWVNKCSATSCPTEVWVTALYPAAQAAALQASAADWPEIWACATDADCRFNGQCVNGACACDSAWRGPSCAALKLLPTPRANGLKHANGSSSWGGSIMRNTSTGTYHMFASFITEQCGLGYWSTNSEIVRATSDTPIGPYSIQQIVAPRFAHEPNLVFGTGPDRVVLLATMNAKTPTDFANCSKPSPNDGAAVIRASDGVALQQPHLHTIEHPARNTYLWSAASAEDIGKQEGQLAIDAVKWNTDSLHNGAVCDTNAAGAVGADGNSVVGIWRHCETKNLHTVPHTLTASKVADPTSYSPNISINFPFMSHAGSEDPMVYTRKTSDGKLVFHAVLHDEQITRCADAPVGCWPGGRHAFSVDGGLTWDYSPFDMYNGTVEYTDGTREDYYLRARPHLLVNDTTGELVALSNGLRPTKASDYVFTLVQPVASRR